MALPCLCIWGYERELDFLSATESTSASTAPAAGDSCDVSAPLRNTIETDGRVKTSTTADHGDARLS